MLIRSHQRYSPDARKVAVGDQHDDSQRDVDRVDQRISRSLFIVFHADSEVRHEVGQSQLDDTHHVLPEPPLVREAINGNQWHSMAIKGDRTCPNRHWCERHR